MLLELGAHVVSNLADTMVGGVANLWVLVLAVEEYGWQHGRNLFRLIDVLANL